MGLEIKFYIYISTACHLTHFGGRVLLSDLRKVRDVGDGLAGWVISNRGFGRSVNSSGAGTRGARGATDPPPNIWQIS